MRWTWPAVWVEERGGWWRLAVTLALLLGGAGLGVALSFAALPAGSRSALGNPADPATMKDLARLFAGLLPKVPALAGLFGGIRWVPHKPAGWGFTGWRPL